MGFVMPALTLVAYVVYEASMPSQYNIRIDLLVIWPALIVVAIVGLYRGIKLVKK